MVEIDFVTNDFLGFAKNTSLAQCVDERFQSFKNTYTETLLSFSGSRLIVGCHPYISNLEDKIAKYHGSEAALITNSGYNANLGLGYIITENDIALYDEDIHISMQEGINHSKGDHYFFNHNDMSDLEDLIMKYKPKTSGKIFVFVCSIYSFDGSRAPLSHLIDLANKYNLYLIVDEAHAIGLCGAKGRGLCSDYGYEHFYAVLVTYSKALGSCGAAILFKQKLKEELIHKALPLRFSTTLSPFNLVTIDTIYDFLRDYGDALRDQVLTLRDYYANKVPQAALGCTQAIRLDGIEAENIALVCAAHGLRVGLVNVLKDPFIRVNLHAYNTKEDLDKLFDSLKEGSNGINIDDKSSLRRKLCFY